MHKIFNPPEIQGEPFLIHQKFKVSPEIQGEPRFSWIRQKKYPCG